MSGSLNKKVLVLNKHWAPIRLISVERAIKTVVRERAEFLDEETFNPHKWDDWCMLTADATTGIKTSSGYVKLPYIVILLSYDKIPAHKVRVSRNNVYVRDKGECQYTGKKLKPKEATIDHIVPTSKGGNNDWNNIVLCSPEINRKKGNRMLEDIGLKLRKKPTAPKWSALYTGMPQEIPPCWLQFLPELRT